MLGTDNRCELPAPPEFVWRFYTDPHAWPLWSGDIEHASADGPMQIGTRGRCKYRMLPQGEFCVTEWEPQRSFTLDWETLLFTHVRFRHELTPVGAHATHVRERIDFHGPLAPVLGVLERPRIRTDWPKSMNCLGELALAAYVRVAGSHRRRQRPRVMARVSFARVLVEVGRLWRWR